MYSKEYREEIEEIIKSGKSINEISLEYGIPETVLEQWREDIKIREHAKELIAYHNFDEATAEIEKLKGEYNEDIKLSLYTTIAILREEFEKAAELLDKQLLNNPNDMKLLQRRSRVAFRKGDIEDSGKFADRQLEIDPFDPEALKNRAKVARKLKEKQTYVELLDRQLEIDPTNEIPLILRLQMAKSQGDEEEINRICNRILNSGSDYRPVVNILRRVGWVTPLERSRSIICSGTDISMEDMEKINSLLEYECSTNRALVLAELYYKVGLKKRAEKSLVAYKRTLDKSKQADELRQVNRAIEMVKSSTTKPYSWREFWDGIDTFNVTKKKTQSSPPPIGDER